MDKVVFERIIKRISTEKFEVDEVSSDWHGVNTNAVFPEYNKLARSENKDDRKKTKSLRKIGKVIGLSLLYQSSQSAAGYTIHSDLGLTPEQAQIHADKWYKGVPTFSKSIKNIINNCKKNGITKTSFNRVRFLPDINGAPDRNGGRPNNKLINYNKRLAINFPVQSVGADQIKLMLLNVGKFIDNNRMSRYTIKGLTNYKVYTRILAISNDNPMIDEFKSELEGIGSGNVKVLIVDGNDKTKVISEYNRNVNITNKMIKKYNLHIIH